MALVYIAQSNQLFINGESAYTDPRFEDAAELRVEVALIGSASEDDTPLSSVKVSKIQNQNTQSAISMVPLSVGVEQLPPWHRHEGKDGSDIVSAATQPVFFNKDLFDESAQILYATPRLWPLPQVRGGGLSFVGKEKIESFV